MSNLYFGVAFFLLLTVIAGMIRVIIGPTRSDRILAAQLFGTTGVAMMLLLAEALNQPAVRDISLVFALLAVIATLVFVQTGDQKVAESQTHHNEETIT